MNEQPITVRALEVVYYNHLRRREGDIFKIRSKKDFSARSMVEVPSGTKQAVVEVEDEAPISMSSPKPPATTAGKAEEVFEDINDEGSDETDSSQGTDDITEGDGALTADSSHKEVVAKCKSMGISIPKGAKKAQLLELINKGG